ncbi:MAG: ABC transporter ATP-binding protein [Candidatus Moranbacteria bacterium]|jgi:ATP-binding cassette subfamily B protein|nr:ABC transporter ATP-binding protein [Candidatus Moranbacteria bacterium]
MWSSSIFIRVLQSYWIAVRQQRGLFAASFILYGLAGFVSGVLTPLVYRRIIDSISGVTDSRMSLVPVLSESLWMLIGVTFCYQILYRIGDFTVSLSESRIIEYLNRRTFGAFMRQKYTFFANRFTGSLVAQSRRYTRAFEEIADVLLFNVWMPVIQVAGIVAALFLIQPIIAWIFLFWIPIYMSTAFWMTKKKLPLDTDSATQDSTLTAHLSDVLSNMFAVKTFASEQEEDIAFGRVAKLDGVARLRSWYFGNILLAFQAILFSVLEISAMYVVIHLWLEGSVSTGTVVLVQVYVGALFGELFGLSRAFGRLMQNIADAREMTEILSRDEIESLEQNQNKKLISGAVSFDKIGFRYPQGSQVFQNFSLAIKEGEKVGLVGSSGSGKSTLTKLLLKFIAPDQGVIRVGGQDISDLSPQHLRRLIAYVPQDTALFHRSIAENISYGRPGSSHEVIEKAAKQAHAHEFIVALPNGYETLVGERGIKLSGGERQRIAIARAILKDAPILVLDEATSALDTTSEHHIQEALHELMRGRTTIVIAHRLSTVREMDRIVVLEDGHLAEEGSHANLITTNGIYAGFWNRQTQSFGDTFIDENEKK